jgi:3-hydroxyacyl-CoA dehydrogenase
MDHAKGQIEGSLLKLAGKKAAKEGTDPAAEEDAARATLARIEMTTDVEAVADSDLVIEAIIENLPIKKKFFEQLGGIVQPHTILASNTSSFPITEMAEASGIPERVCGIHYFNPVQLMRLVEVVSTEHTNKEIVDEMVAFVKKTGKVPVTCGDTPGFIVNRLLVPYIAQGVAMLARGDATAEDIDTAMRLGAGYPMGPITLSDYVGNDINLAVMQGWTEADPENPAFQIPEGVELLEKMVAENKLGRKTGQGFYKWEGNKRV